MGGDEEFGICCASDVSLDTEQGSNGHAAEEKEKRVDVSSKLGPVESKFRARPERTQ